MSGEHSVRHTSGILPSALLGRLDRLALLARRRASADTSAHRAERRGRQHGSSLEFADHRPYAAGDDLRRVDWPLAGRSERLFLKLYEEERDLPVHLLIDGSRSMRWRPEDDGETAGARTTAAFPRPTKFDVARGLAAALAYVGLHRHDPVGLAALTAGGLGPELGAGRGRGHFRRTLDFLGRLEEHDAAGAGGSATTDLRGSLRLFGQRSARRRGLVFVLSDFFDAADGHLEGIDFLLHARCEVRLIQVLDPAELDPALRGDLRLRDAEAEDARAPLLEVTADDALLRRYRRELERFQKTLRDHCARRGVDLFETRTDVPLEDAVLGLLRAGLLTA